jgi:rhodanese-related sulfurtransferase
LAYKWFQRYSMIRALRMDRITVQELRDLIASGAAPVIIDARPKELQEIGLVIPGALTVTPESLVALAERLRVTAEVVIYCACPNEVSAAKIALQLKGLGVKKVRPLQGGIEAWLAAPALT